MKIYEKRQRKKRKTLCSYCGAEGHLWVTCPHPKTHKEQIEAGLEIDLSLLSPLLRQRYSLNKTASEPFLEKKAFECYAKQQSRSVRKSKKRKTKRRCGFCNSPSHNRKNCKVMHELVSDLALANQNYRRKFYQAFVKEQGIAEGALVNVKAHSLRLRNETIYDYEGVGIITMIDWSSVNLGLASDLYWYGDRLKVDCLLEGETYSMLSPFSCGTEKGDIIKEPLISKGFCCPNSVVITSVLSPSLTKPSVEWFEEGYDNCWEWVTKNKTLPELGSALAPLLERYHPNQNSAFQRRLARYKKK